MIKFQNISKIYPANSSGLKETVALDNVSFEIKEKEFVSIIGKSGAGKTTLLKLLLVQEVPTKGRIFFEGRDINKIDSKELPLLRRKIGVVFQDYKLIFSKNVYENVAYAMEVIGASDEEVNSDVPKILEIVNLTDKAYNFPSELSAGEKQRVSIARALIHRPKVILADEPTGNLDPYNTLEIIKLLLKIQEMGTTMVLTTHNKSVIDYLGRRVITLENGRIIRDDQRGSFVL